MRDLARLVLFALLLAGCAPQAEEHGRIHTITIGMNAGEGHAPIELMMPGGLAETTTVTLPDTGIPVSFTVTPGNGVAGERYYYAVYYRNESYKFNESTAEGTQHPFAEENFYGCALGQSGAFTPTDRVAPEEDLRITTDLVLRSDPREEVPGVPSGRDPRVGEYALLVVAVPESAFAGLPEAVRDIRKKENGHYVEPWWYWLHGPGAHVPGAVVGTVPRALRLRCSPDPARGIAQCGSGAADFEQFLNHIDPASRFNNIPVVADVLANDFTPRDHDSAMCFTTQDRWVSTLTSVAANPCATVRYDSSLHALEIRNPSCADGVLRKENVGVATRRRFTYGRFLVHAQLSPLVNDSDLWNGLTNAIWLIGSDERAGMRRRCDGGYRPYGSDTSIQMRVPNSCYAEIDFEIMKGMPLCPERSFPPIYPQQVADATHTNAWLRKLPTEVTQQRGNVSVACTNWDLACPDPPAFAIGCQDVRLSDQVFTAHRWDKDYRAITEKSMEPDDELFGPNGYWFEIDWRPEEIIWRIGPSPEKLRAVGYMNSSMTSIPNVPMQLVVTQEFHNTDWWPGAPYAQGGIPFPAKDLVGRVLEVRVE
jgi:hypothetical protein